MCPLSFVQCWHWVVLILCPNSNICLVISAMRRSLTGESHVAVLGEWKCILNHAFKKVSMITAHLRLLLTFGPSFKHQKDRLLLCGVVSLYYTKQCRVNSQAPLDFPVGTLLTLALVDLQATRNASSRIHEQQFSTLCSWKKLPVQLIYSLFWTLQTRKFTLNCKLIILEQQ